MDEAEKEKLKGVLLSGVPYDGSIGNNKLRESFIAEAVGAGYIVDETIFETLKSDLVAGASTTCGTAANDATYPITSFASPMGR